MSKNTLAFAVLLFLIAVIVFLLGLRDKLKEDAQNRRLIEDVNSTISFDWPGA